MKTIRQTSFVILIS